VAPYLACRSPGDQCFLSRVGTIESDPFGFTIHHSGGEQTVSVDQRTGGGHWNLLGSYTLAPGQDHREVLTDQADGYVIADAVRFTPLQPVASPAGVYYYHNVHLGTPQRRSDQNARVVWEARYLPFGQVELVTEEVESHLRFPGQYFDRETGQHYNYFRDYDPPIGRYIESDSIGILQDYSDPQLQIAIELGLIASERKNVSFDVRKSTGFRVNNLYGYPLMDPVNNLDPNGLSVCSLNDKVCDEKAFAICNTGCLALGAVCFISCTLSRVIPPSACAVICSSVTFVCTKDCQK